MSEITNEIVPVSASLDSIPDTAWEAINNALMKGDLAKLFPKEKNALYQKTCESVGLNYLTKPFGYIVLNGKETLYATRNCTDQLCKIHGISILETEERMDQETRVYSVKVKMADRSGRIGINRGDVFIPKNMVGIDIANSYMKAHTKALRRCTLSMVGLSFLDETEVGDIPNAKPPVLEQPKSEPMATNAQKAGLFATFSEKSKTNPDLKKQMREKFPGIDSTKMTIVEYDEVTAWLNGV